VRSGGRRIVRNPRFRLIGAVSLLLAAGAVGLAWVVLTSPGYGLDHPGGFTPGGRVLATIGCGIAAVAFAAIGIGGLRVALILDDTGLLIRNPFRTTGGIHMV